jgi:2'-5' RNA ligase
VTGSGHARLFVALDLPADVREALGWWGREARHTAGPMRVLDIESLHVTLVFLGSRSVDEIDVVAGMVAAEAGSPVGTLSLGAPLWLPRRRPRLLAVELHDDSGGLAALQARLAAALAGVLGDWEPDRRAFHPHVTVARMRNGSGLRGKVLPPTPGEAFEAASVTLYRSWLAPSGSTYEGLASAGLG